MTQPYDKSNGSRTALYQQREGISSAKNEGRALTQIALFDTDTCIVVPAKPDPYAGVDMDALQDYAFLYTGTEKGNHSGIRFMMSTADAMTWCKSPLSRGVLHGVEWAYFWTSVRSFVGCYWCAQSPEIDLSKESDNGQWDAKMAQVGVRKIELDEIKSILAPLGVRVIR